MTQHQKRRGGLVATRSTALSYKNQESADTPLFKAALKGGLLGIGVSIGLGMALVTLASALIYLNPDPSALIAPISLLCLLPSMFFGGFAAAKRVGDAPMLCGILSGGMVTLVTMLLGIILWGLPSSGYAFWQSAALHTAAMAFSTLGAFAGNVKRKPKPAKKRFGR